MLSAAPCGLTLIGNNNHNRDRRRRTSSRQNSERNTCRLDRCPSDRAGSVESAVLMIAGMALLLGVVVYSEGVVMFYVHEKKPDGARFSFRFLHWWPPRG